jgi:hypothetical protein
MSDFEQQLKAAIARGEKRGRSEQQEAALLKANAEQLKRLHTQYRLTLSENIESVVRKLIDHFPGFRYEGVFGDSGWGAACWRDNLTMSGRERKSEYSRFEMAIRPLNEFFVLDLQAKGTIANRQALVRNYFQPLSEVDLDHFKKLIDAWALTFAEMYSASQVR